MAFVLYNHIGSANHGCEALVRTISVLLGEKNTILLSDTPMEEERYGITDIVKVIPAVSDEKGSFWSFVYAYLKLKLAGNYFYMDILPYKPAIKRLNANDILVSIGGDIFCYENYPKYNLLHQYALKHIKRSILVGCSIETNLLSDENLLQDLKSFEIITARESITYNALKRAGIENVIFCPDSAFLLPVSETVLPENFIPRNTVGVNISPLVLRKASDEQLIMDNFRELINHILSFSNASVALIAHVVSEGNDDRVPLQTLYNEFKKSNRICMIEDQDSQKLKWIISQCSFFVGARTHATIAAYSTSVPTLAVGYSVKSIGIARDIFGTEEGYVLSYREIAMKDDILKKFNWITAHSVEIKKTLAERKEEYRERLLRAGDMLRKKYVGKGLDEEK